MSEVATLSSAAVAVSFIGADRGSSMSSDQSTRGMILVNEEVAIGERRLRTGNLQSPARINPNREGLTYRGRSKSNRKPNNIVVRATSFVGDLVATRMDPRDAVQPALRRRPMPVGAFALICSVIGSEPLPTIEHRLNTGQSPLHLLASTRGNPPRHVFGRIADMFSAAAHTDWRIAVPSRN
jgi:hypothetical protein